MLRTSAAGLLSLMLLSLPSICFSDMRTKPIEGGKITLEDVGLGSRKEVNITFERSGAVSDTLSLKGVVVDGAQIYEHVKLCATCQSNSFVIRLDEVLFEDPANPGVFDLTPQVLHKIVVLDSNRLYLLPFPNADLSNELPDKTRKIMISDGSREPVGVDFINGQFYQGIESLNDEFFPPSTEQISSAEEGEVLFGHTWSQDRDWVVVMRNVEPYDCFASTAAADGLHISGIEIGSDRRQGTWTIAVGSQSWETFTSGLYDVQYIVDGKPSVDGSMYYSFLFGEDEPAAFTANMDASGFGVVAEALSKGKSFVLRVYDVSASRKILNSAELSLLGSTKALFALGECVAAEGKMHRRPLDIPYSQNSFFGFRVIE